MSKTKNILIPIQLAKLLSAEDSDFKSDANKEESRTVARAMLRLLMEMNKK